MKKTQSGEITLFALISLAVIVLATVFINRTTPTSQDIRSKAATTCISVTNVDTNPQPPMTKGSNFDCNVTVDGGANSPWIACGLSVNGGWPLNICPSDGGGFGGWSGNTANFHCTMPGDIDPNATLKMIGFDFSSSCGPFTDKAKSKVITIPTPSPTAGPSPTTDPNAPTPTITPTPDPNAPTPTPTTSAGRPSPTTPPAALRDGVLCPRPVMDSIIQKIAAGQQLTDEDQAFFEACVAVCSNPGIQVCTSLWIPSDNYKFTNTQCSPVLNPANKCSVQYLMTAGPFKNLEAATKASIICKNESGGNEEIISKLNCLNELPQDRTNEYSIGLFQINLVNPENCPIVTYPIFKTHIANPPSCTKFEKSDGDKYYNLDRCVTYQQNPITNMSRAYELSYSGTKWSDHWKYSSTCGID